MRVAFVISDQHAIIAGGIGQFAKGFCEQVATPNNIFVDFILDKKPTSTLLSKINFKGGVYYPNTGLSYVNHTKTFSFGESINWEKHLNFRDSMMLALSKTTYDLIIVNSPDAFAPIYGLGLSSKVKTVFYTHSEYLVGFEEYKASTFYQQYIDYIKNLMSLPDVIVGTQTKGNIKGIASYLKNKTAVELKMPIPEKSMLSKIDCQKNGVLFVGRYEDRKGPEDFLKVIGETKLYPKVLTNKKGAKKFQKAFEIMGLVAGKDYDIRENLIGEEKVQFIASARVFYNPSKLESFGYSMLEGLSQCDTVAIKYPWLENFDNYHFTVVALDDKCSSAYIKNLHDTPPLHDNQSKINDYNSSAILDWLSLLRLDDTNPEPNKKLDKDNFWVEVALTFDNRPCSIEDVVVLLNHKSEYEIIDTENGQWWTKSNTPPSNKSSNSFF